LVVAVVIAGGAAAFVWFAGGSGEPSIQLTAPPVATSAETTASTEAAAAETTTAPAAPEFFAIVGEESQAAFELDEVLRGSPKQVVGTTSDVAGEIFIDADDLAGSEIGAIVINARTFTTGSSFRDRAIRGPVILNSAEDAFELITFQPTAIEGLSGPVVAGKEFGFRVIGDLSIKGTTRPVTFEVLATLVGDDRLEGHAQTQVLRADFGIGIPNAPGVANVSEEVVISLEFVAIKA
jgi:polyisoprenoid-binding protein YceI